MKLRTIIVYSNCFHFGGYTASLEKVYCFLLTGFSMPTKKVVLSANRLTFWAELSPFYVIAKQQRVELNGLSPNANRDKRRFKPYQNIPRTRQDKHPQGDSQVSHS